MPTKEQDITQRLRDAIARASKRLSAESVRSTSGSSTKPQKSKPGTPGSRGERVYDDGGTIDMPDVSSLPMVGSDRTQEVQSYQEGAKGPGLVERVKEGLAKGGKGSAVASMPGQPLVDVKDTPLMNQESFDKGGRVSSLPRVKVSDGHHKMIIASEGSAYLHLRRTRIMKHSTPMPAYNLFVPIYTMLGVTCLMSLLNRLMNNS